MNEEGDVAYCPRDVISEHDLMKSFHICSTYLVNIECGGSLNTYTFEQSARATHVQGAIVDFENPS